MKMKVTYELHTREGVAELLAATRHLDLRPEVSTVALTDEELAKDTVVAETYEDRAEMTRTLGWADIAVTFAQNLSQDGYDVEVQDNDGIMVKTFVYLHEWSGEVTAYINDQDAMGLINYLIGLNTTTEGMRDGTTIR